MGLSVCPGACTRVAITEKRRDDPLFEQRQSGYTGWWDNPTGGIGVSRDMAVRVDEKGRLTLPREVRQALGVEAGDVFFLQVEGRILRLARAENPFDALAERALEEFESGQTRSLRQVAKDLGVDVGNG